MKQNKTSLHWLALGSDLIECLRSGSRQRMNRYDAFIWMMEHIQNGVKIKDEYGEVVKTMPYSASYKRLGEDWNWDRTTVQNFIEDLVALSVIQTKREGSTIVFTLGKKSYKQLVL